MSDPIARLNAALEGRYRVERELGEGGMATVYLAVDLKHDRKVALKVLRPALGDMLGAERFHREIRIAAPLSHPNIVGLIDSGEAGGFLYYVMFLVDGESLRDRLSRETQLPVDDALRISREVGDALSYAHERGVVHRDVKPENILLEGGHALVADFGIARAIQDVGPDRLTGTGLAIGTAAYMSPEQATGAHGVDGRADVYSLACVVYEMLVGDTPFAGPTGPSMLARKTLEAPRSIRVVRPSVPEAVERGILRALAPTPADRQSTVAEFLADIEGRGARRTNARGDRRAPVRWSVVAPAAAAVVVAIAVGVGAGLRFHRDGAGPVVTSFAQITSEPGVEDGPCLSPDGEWIVYAGDVDGDRDIFLRDIGGQNPLMLTPDSPDDDTQPAFSPDGRQIAFRSERDGGGIFVMGRTGEGVRRVTEDGYSPSWSPDGSKLVYSLEDLGITPLNWDLLSDLWVVDVEGGEPSRLGVVDGTDPDWSPGGERIVYSTRNMGGQLGNLDLATIPSRGVGESKLTEGEANDWGPVWSADGRHVYFVSDRGGSMNLWRVGVDEDSGRPRGAPEPVTAPAQFVAHPCVSADGTGIVFSSLLTTAQNALRMSFDPAALTVGEPTWLTTGSRRWANPDPSPDGTRVALYSQDRPEGDLYVVESDGSGLRQVTADSAVDRMPRWSPRGDAIAYFSSRGGPLDLWTIHPDGSANTRITSGGSGTTPAWSPDGSRIAVATSRSSAILERAGPDGPWRQRDLPDVDSVGAFKVNDWSPDGRYLVGSVDFRDTGIVLYSLADEVYETLTHFGQWPIFLPDNRRILFVSRGHEFHVVDAVTREVTEIYSTALDVVGPPRITSDGRAIFFTRRVTEGDVWLATLR